MAWMTSRIFLSQARQEAAVSALSSMLEQGLHLADESNLLSEAPPLFISPAVEGWIAITDVRASFDDVKWAGAALAQRLDARVVTCEIMGTAYRFRGAEFRGATIVDQQAVPQTGWNLDGAEPGGEMPCYQDVEQIAYEYLRQAGIPGALITLGCDPLGGTETAYLGKGVTMRLAGESVAQATVDATGRGFDGDDAPVFIQNINRDFGVMIFEDRYVMGCPHEAALDSLVALEEALLGRARRALPEETSDRFSLTVTYHGGTRQALLDELLRRRSRHVPPRHRSNRNPWWKFWHYWGRRR